MTTHGTPSPRRSRRARAAVSLGLALLVAGTASPVAAHPLDNVPEGGARGAGPAADPPGGEGLTQDLPSIHWQHAQEHAMDVIAFEPGGQVSVGFRPRADDRWLVDGERPRPLPAGHATGRQMRDSAQGSVWAAGAPGKRGAAAGPAQADDPRADARADGLDETIDQPIGAVGALAEPAGTSSSRVADSAAAAPVSSTGLRREVFGFLPYWELSNRSTTLDWRTLSTVAYFGVGCTPSGSLAKRNADGSTTAGWAGWTSSKMTSIIDAAHEHGTRVVLTVTCMAWTSSGAGMQAALLGSSSARATLARQVAAAVRDRGADGVNLDFEPIVAGYADEFTALVRRIRLELNNLGRGYQLTFDAMASIDNQPIADATAPGGADAVFVMGYDYRLAGAAYAGSISPLTGPIYDITDTIDAYTARISPSKIILGIPYYGRAWSTASNAVRARTLSPSKYGSSAVPLYDEAIRIALANGRRWDAVEQAAWTAYRKQTCTSTYGCVTSWRELYYEDATSLKRRYDLVNREQLRGVGIWALGFEGTRSELRAALAEKFLADTTPPVVGIRALAQTQRDAGFRVAWTAWDDGRVTGYDVDVFTSGGTWQRWYTGTTATSATYPGRDGRAYAFRVRATDAHGNVSAWSGAGPTPSLRTPARIAVGGFATVLADGLRMRTSASTGATVMTTLDAGAILRVTGGPVVRGGYTWFQVTGPVAQWATVDRTQVGGWVAAFGNGVVNAGPRRPPYATIVDAGITDLRLNAGGLRVLTPRVPAHATVRVTWTSHVDFDGLALQVVRLNRTVAGRVRLNATAAGSHAYAWDGRLNGSLLPSGAYVLQLVGRRGSATYTAPSISPVSPTQVASVGLIIGPVAPTSVRSFTSTPASPTRSGDLAYRLVFGGPVSALSGEDFVRTGTASGCRVGAPTGSGATWAIRVTGCGPGTVQLSLRAWAVRDAVSNVGPAVSFAAPRVVIDRAAPVAAPPRVGWRTGFGLASSSPTATFAGTLGWTAVDRGSAGVRDFDVRRSVDGGAWTDLAVDTRSHSMAVALTPGHSYRYQLRASDRAGNLGPWVTSPTIPVVLRQNDSPTITYSGSWALGTGGSYSGGSVRYATAAGASLRYSFTGRSVGLVMSRRPDGGKVKVYLDGTYVATLDTAAATAAYRHVLFSRTWSSAGTHTLRLVVVGGTAGHARVDVDAIALLR